MPKSGIPDFGWGDGIPSLLIADLDTNILKSGKPDFGCASAVSFEGRFAATSG